MSEIKDDNNPSFVLFPVNNDRTGWKPFGLPVILVVPRRKTRSGDPIANSQVFNVKVYIEDVPQEARVAGHTNIGLRSPDRELFAVTLDSFDLSDRAIRINDYSITRDGIEISEAEYGDLIQYTTSTGITDTIKYIPGANYYDLSDVEIDFEHLPSDRYNLVYQAEYFSRIMSNDNSTELLCIDASSIALALLRFDVKHPGEVLDEFYRHTPQPYLTSAKKSQDTTLALYRPFTDIIQDIMDEQDLLESINWVFEAPPEAIPYLSQLLGWDIPYFPESLDKLRRAVLRRTVEFQNLAGSRRAITNIFRLFGFEILISNLWWSADGNRLIRPDESLPLEYRPQRIITLERYQVENLLAGWNEGGFGAFDIPLLYRPQELTGVNDFAAIRDGGNVTIECYLVEHDSDAYTELIAISEAILEDPSGYGEKSGFGTDSGGYFLTNDISSRLSGLEVLGYSQILISGKSGDAVDEVIAGREIPLRKSGISLNRETNTLSMTLNGDIDTEGGIRGPKRSVFTFVAYKRQEFVVPDVIKHLQSNRFDILVTTDETLESPAVSESVFLDFAIEFLFRLKAFHSLLNRITYNISLNDTYEVTNWCVGGDIAQRFDTDAGTLQVPPAIIPNLPSDINDCTKLDPRSLGYKDSDILLRLRKLTNLPEEHAVWKKLDARTDQPIGSTRLSLMQSADRDSCKYTHHGQDRITGSRTELNEIEFGPSPNSNSGVAGFFSNTNTSPIERADNGEFNKTGVESTSRNDSGIYGSFTREYSGVSEPLCNLDAEVDFCYKGRVDDELLYKPTLTVFDVVNLKPCSLDLGVGLYYLYPSTSKIVVRGVKKPCHDSKTQRSQFSGGAKIDGVKHYVTGVQSNYLSAVYDRPIDRNSHLSRLYRDYSTPSPETLHFTNRPQGFEHDQRFQLALQRPTLNIEKPILHFPGCRFPMLNALTDDFYHPEWEARPWDDDFSTYCGPTSACSNQPSFLNCKKITDDDGNERLVFDSRPFQVLGNGLVPDVSSLGDHVLSISHVFSVNDVVHKVYTQHAESHEAIELDGVSGFGTDGELVSTDRPLFNSHNSCETDIVDFADGYPSETGIKLFESQNLGQSLYDEVLMDGLGVPTFNLGPLPFLIFLGSGIRDDSLALRLDCGCLLVDCGSTSPGETICSSNSFIDSDGFYDWQPDHLEVRSVLKFNESIGASSMTLDGMIPSLLET